MSVVAMGGAITASEEITFNPEMKKEEQKEKSGNIIIKIDDHPLEKNSQKDDEDHDEDDGAKIMKSEGGLDLGPQLCLKNQLEKDKDGESLRKWKDQLVRSVDFSFAGEIKDPEVQILSLSIICPGRADLRLPIPPGPAAAANSKSSSSSLLFFTLKEGTPYRIEFSFSVSNSIVSGLKYANTVWKTGVRVDNSKVMLGTFSPKQEPYKYELEEDTTPSGMFARGSYSARTKVIDDDGKCYLDINYSFEILKQWPSP